VGMLRFLVAVFALTLVVWALAVFVPYFQGFHHLANLGFQFSVYLLAIAVLLQGFRLLTRRRVR
jgi:hypothetical protein